MAEYTFTYPNVPEAEESMHDHVTETLCANGLGPLELKKVLLVISEAFTNAYLHGNQKDPSKRIIIQLSINTQWLRADIIDEGISGCEGAIAKTSQCGNLPEYEAENGRGIMLMKTYSSDISFSRADNGGLKVSVIIELENKKEVETSK